MFEERKARFVERLLKEGSEGRVDFDLFDFLIYFNKSTQDYYTSSSCSGRIILAAARHLSFAKSKGGVKAIAKWHRPITPSELVNSMPPQGDLWLLVRGPIIHFIARDLDKAIELSKVAMEAGFKRGGILSIKEWGVVVEVESDDRLDVPLRIGGKAVYSDLAPIVDLANETLMFGKIRLSNLIRLIEYRLLKRDVDPTLIKPKPYREFKMGDVHGSAN